MIYRIVRSRRRDGTCHDIGCHGSERCVCRTSNFPKVFEGQPGDIVLLLHRIDHFSTNDDPDWENVYSHLLLYNGELVSVVGDEYDLEFEAMSNG